MLLRPFLLLSAITLLLLSGRSIAQDAKSEADSVAEIALSDETLQLRYIDTGDYVGVEGSRLAGAFFLSEDRDVVLSAGLQFPTDFDLGPLSFTFGPQLYAALLDEENSDVMAISIGAEVRLDVIPSLGLAIAGHAYYAPDVLTFGSGDNLTDLSARLEVGLADSVTLFGGMRWFEFDLIEGAGKRTLQEELFAGFGYRF
jgi:hypothetical protein